MKFIALVVPLIAVTTVQGGLGSLREQLMKRVTNTIIDDGECWEVIDGQRIWKKTCDEM